ncbi:glutamyl-tRNA reductase [Sediminibacterium sp.]|uniref:glutamyl-tRNA reductase n=1 Tax=Sediminibacterium sp. TaxID=1917865 RepID=UPI0025D6743C|nr:glutamyl-tRNA reductase [Sediminibacterium sp.]MBW0177521.1 glutamyl-tRNA reductase [Sediminibacterium sp.]
MEKGQFFVAGINYKKTDAAIRGDFAINPDQYSSILSNAAKLGLKELFVLSTCNRTEIYGLAPDADTLIHLLCEVTVGDAETFLQLCYIKKDAAALEHIFSVGAGLDSQILGDYEIVGQMKLAVKFAKEKGMIGSFMERLFNTVLQSSKQIKNETALSGGTISVSFAAIQFIREQLADTSNKKIVLLGTGKIGRNTCKNLVDYLDTRNITLINRTEERAIELAAGMSLMHANWNELETEVHHADIVIVATNAEKPVLNTVNVKSDRPKILIDLSIPNNIEPSLAQQPGIVLANVDDLSRINDQTIRKRRAEVPRALAIIKHHMQEFMVWSSQRRHVPVLKAVKQKLHDMHSCGLFLTSRRASEDINTEAIQKVVNNVAVKMRNRHQPGCYYIEAINDFMTSSH